MDRWQDKTEKTKLSSQPVTWSRLWFGWCGWPWGGGATFALLGKEVQVEAVGCSKNGDEQSNTHRKTKKNT